MFQSKMFSNVFKSCTLCSKLLILRTVKSFSTEFHGSSSHESGGLRRATSYSRSALLSLTFRIEWTSTRRFKQFSVCWTVELFTDDGWRDGRCGQSLITWPVYVLQYEHHILLRLSGRDFEPEFPWWSDETERWSNFAFSSCSVIFANVDSRSAAYSNARLHIFW